VSVSSDRFDLILLGTGAAYPPADRENTSLALDWPDGVLLVDCGASPHRRLRQAGLDPDRLVGVLITHGHPDHLYGLPSLVHCLLPSERIRRLPVLAPPETLKVARQIVGAFNLVDREQLDLEFIELPLDDAADRVVQQMNGLRIGTAPVAHGREAIGVRAEVHGRVLAYTGDTEPCEGVRSLARGAHMLVHEATFSERDRTRMPAGHSTARDAGRAADEAGAETLLLVHFLAETLRDPARLQQEAAEACEARVILGEDLERYPV
jgi:ribonuclease Z